MFSKWEARSLMCCLLAVSVFILRLAPSVGSFLNLWYLVLAFARASFGREVKSVDDLNSS